ncbi:MAG: tRNA (adenosine(37)-N6)-dimethylallyltransferase MiaA [Terracidiphilus sp.]
MSLTDEQTKPLVVIVLGPTGSGKTALSLKLAERFGGEIVSCDSVAVYRGMEVGTAKPTLAERNRVPHHLIDVTTPDVPFTAGEYSRQARAALKEIAARGLLPIVTGGTGLYLRALTDGLFDGPTRQEGLRARLARSRERHGDGWLHRVLLRLDPRSAARIHANDTAKLMRAIEVCLAVRRPMSEVLGKREKARDPLTGFRLLRIGLNPPRQVLYERLNRRAAEMFADGLAEETRGLLERYGPVKALDSLGYRQARAVVEGKLKEQAGIEAAQQGHRNYAKRQMTWFRREPEVQWLEGFGDEAETVRAAMVIVEKQGTKGLGTRDLGHGDLLRGRFEL